MPAHQPIRILGPQFAPAWHRPQFRYIDPVPGAEGGPTPGSGEVDFLPADDQLSDEEFLTKRGFPRGVKRDDMPVEQQLTSLRYEARKWQYLRDVDKRAVTQYAQFGTVEELQSAKDAADQARLAALGDNERAIEEAKSAGRAEGIAQSKNQNLDIAVKGMLIALTKGADETFEAASTRVDGAIAFADLTKFIGDNGELDAAKVQTFAQSTVSAGGNGPQSSWGERFNQDHQGRLTPAPGATGSVAAMEQAIYDAKKPPTA